MDYVLNQIFQINNGVMQFIVIPIIVLLSLFISFKLKFFHIINLILVFKRMLNIGSQKTQSRKGLTSFYAFAIILGGNLGVGNIAGTAMALTFAGPGAVVWMCGISIVASVIKYSCCVLGVKFRNKKKDGNFVGGPMYYIRDVLGYKTISSIFALSIIFGAITVGNFIQVNSLSLPMQYLNINPFFAGLIIAIMILFVTMGGLRVFTKVISNVVPFMAILYIGACITIIILKSDELIPTLKLIWTSSLGKTSIAGGLIGFSIVETFKIMQVGVSRAILATDIGLGLEAIVHSGVRSHAPDDKLPLTVEQGLISTLSPFIVMLISLMTTIVLIITGAWKSGMKSSQMCFEAFRIGLSSDWAGYLLMAILFSFAFTTILTWLFCADKAVEFFTHKHFWKKLWHIFFVMIVPIGSILNIDVVWGLADVVISVILIINILALTLMHKIVVKETQHSII